MKKGVRKRIFRLVMTPLLLLMVFIFAFLSPEEPDEKEGFEFYFRESPPPFLNDSTKWIDSVFNSLSTKEKIAQLLMIAAYPNAGQSHIDDLNLIIKKFNVGGVIYFKGKPGKYCFAYKRVTKQCKNSPVNCY